MTDIRPFSIDIADTDLEDLKRRIEATRWPEAECVDDWSQGMPLAYTRELADYWANEYDWRAAEADLNRFPQFKTEIDGLDIHFIHQRSPHEDAFPLLITHGWPGSVYEFHKVIDPLTNPTDHGGEAEDAFHVVCPSIPGYAFSDKPTAHGTGVEKIATMWDALMVRLGYERYGAQGGDWGSAITTQIGRENRGHCAGIHVNMPLGRPTEEAMANPTDADKDAMAAAQEYQQWDSGYSTQQRTRPSNPRLRPRRLARRADGLDRREVLEVDRQRRLARGRPHSRRDAHQRDAVLAPRLWCLVGPPVLGELRRVRRAQPCRGPHRSRVVPPRDHQVAAQLV